MVVQDALTELAAELIGYATANEEVGEPERAAALRQAAGMVYELRRQHYCAAVVGSPGLADAREEAMAGEKWEVPSTA